MFTDVGFHLKILIQEIIVFTDVGFHFNSGFRKILCTPLFPLLVILKYPSLNKTKRSHFFLCNFFLRPVCKKSDKLSENFDLVFVFSTLHLMKDSSISIYILLS